MARHPREAAAVMSTRPLTQLAHHAHAYHLGPLIEQLLALLEIDPEQLPQPDRLQLRVSPGLGFPCADVLTLDIKSSPRLEVGFLGLHGSQSPLPGYYLDELAWQHAHQQPRLIALLDLFHHRWLMLLYRGWRKYRYELRFRAGADPLSRCLLAMRGNPGLPLQPEQWLANSWLRTAPAPSAAALCSLIQHSLQLPSVQLQPWQRRQVPIPAGQQNRLGVQACRLGHDGLLGSQIADCAGKFRLRLKQLSRQQFYRLLPNGDLYQRLKHQVIQQVHALLAWDLVLELAHDQAPLWQLGEDPEVRLGWSNYLGHPHPTPSLRLSVEE